MVSISITRSIKKKNGALRALVRRVEEDWSLTSSRSFMELESNSNLIMPKTSLLWRKASL